MKLTSQLFTAIVLLVSLLTSSSFAEIQNRQNSKKPGRKVDLSLSKKVTRTHYAPRDRNDGYEKIDMAEFKEFETSMKSRNAVKLNCTSKTGIVHTSKDAGFDNCVRQAELEKSSQHKPSDPNSTSVGVEFGETN